MNLCKLERIRTFAIFRDSQLKIFIKSKKDNKSLFQESI